MPSATESSNIVSDVGLDDAGRALANRGAGYFMTLVYSAGCRPEGFLLMRTFPSLTRRFTTVQTKLRFFVPIALARPGVVHFGCF